MKHMKLFLILPLVLLSIGGCVKKNTIMYDKGGSVIEYILRGIYYRHSDEPLIVSGECYSACTLMVDYARPNVCIGWRGALYFHKGRTASGERVDLPYSDDLQNWIDNKGGLPEDGWLEISDRDWETLGRA